MGSRMNSDHLRPVNSEPGIRPLVFKSIILFIFLQIKDLNRRVSAIEYFLNNLEKKVTSPYDQVNPGH